MVGNNNNTNMNMNSIKESRMVSNNSNNKGSNIMGNV